MSQAARQADKPASRRGVVATSFLSLCPVVSGSALVLGYGNELRGDDGVGPQIARAVAALGLPNVRTLALHQLSPELTELLADAGYALFVDAYHQAGTGSNVTLRPIAPLERPAVSAHVADPSALLALTQVVYGRCPRAWSIAVPAASFEYGVNLSPTATMGVAAALRLIRYLLVTLRSEPCTRSG